MVCSVWSWWFGAPFSVRWFGGFLGGAFSSSLQGRLGVDKIDGVGNGYLNAK